MTPKTYKREVALVLFGVLGAFFVWGVFEPEAMRVAEFLTLPIFTFGGGAFAIDAVIRQGGR